MGYSPEFESHINESLEEFASEFLKHIDDAPFTGLRVNTLKCQNDNLQKIFKNLKPTPFCKNGFYTGEEKLGNHPLHHAGAFYIQEPSATSAVTALNPQPGERILDLCASPGGKTTQIAAAMGGKGLLVSNEYVSQRVQALVSNVERCGITNCVVTNESAERLCSHFAGFFNRVLVDAPCSGEGMIRKDRAILNEWNKGNVLGCAARQKTILDAAANSVKQGGTLCYSTCTLAREENEEVVLHFLKTHPDFFLAKIEEQFGSPAFEIKGGEGYNLNYARRILPCSGGEGHFVALMRRKSDYSYTNSDIIPTIAEVSASKKTTKKGGKPKPAAAGITPREAFFKFYKENFEDDIDLETTDIIELGERVLLSPKTPSLQGLSVVRAGVFAGTLQKNRFQPSHALFCRAECRAKRVLNLATESDEIKAFIHGEEITCPHELSGYTAVLVNGIPLGFGKASGGRLKNHYPKGLRTLNK